MTPVKEVTFERTFDASLETVWQAWTNPDILKEWWGPNGVSIPECELDVHVGGELYIVMEAGAALGDFKGTRWPMKGTYTIVEAPTRLSYTSKAWTEGQEETTEIDQTSELSLVDDGGKTQMTLKVTINKTGPAAGMAVQGMQMGFNQQFDKLTNFLKN
jgi:uncharacterized protein YndB with AHSA1/START domain